MMMIVIVIVITITITITIMILITIICPSFYQIFDQKNTFTKAGDLSKDFWAFQRKSPF